jgi:hypothetical protein
MIFRLRQDRLMGSAVLKHFHLCSTGFVRYLF